MSFSTATGDYTNNGSPGVPLAGVVSVTGILRQLSTLHQLKTLNYLQLKLTLYFPFDIMRPLCGAVLSTSSPSLF
jgi:hypothetical protein